MPLPIENYAMIGDCRTAALVGRDGSIDWLCVPRFDSGACFAALLGGPEHGRWRIAPAGEITRVERRYRSSTLVLETDFTTDAGSVRLVDAMSIQCPTPTVIRTVRGLRGQVPMRLELIIRFDYGSIIPWVRKSDGGISAIAGPDMLRLRSDVEIRGERMTSVADFTVSEGQEVSFSMAWHPSHEDPPAAIDVSRAMKETEHWWCHWSGRCAPMDDDQQAITRSLITLKALTYAPTGGIAAAPTTSLPEKIGGVRNWDYRYCWVRDATFTLYALMNAGFHEEALAWREWLLRAVAGKPENLQIMYGLGGERRLMEFVVPWLPGYENSAPVRIGNNAAQQYQLDVYGELFDVLHQTRRLGLAPLEDAWRMQEVMLGFLETGWQQPDEGIWEVRGGRQQFTHSKVMAWVAFDRAIKSAEQFDLEGPVEHWRHLRSEIHKQVCERGYDSDRGTFVQHYGSRDLDASLLMIPLVGFLPAEDPRMIGTVEAIIRELRRDGGLIARYSNRETVDGLPPGEGAFLPCTFWLADNLYLQGRHDEARAIFDQLLELRNDVGLLSEEYDTEARRMLGNFPQAFSHISLVNTAFNLGRSAGPADQRPGC